jgi:hypothetical protein
MWVVPLVAAIVAFGFAFLLGRQFAERRRPFQLFWTLALLQFAIASVAVAVGVGRGWTESWFDVYWALGAVLNVPFLAAGEVVLLFRRRWVLWASWLVLVFATAYTVAVLKAADVNTAALAEQLPSGKDVFGAGSAAHRLPQLFSIPAFVILLAGTAWSAWKLRGRPDQKDRFVGTLLIAVGASIVAGGATFAAYGLVVGFIATLVIGIVVMFLGFLRASRPPGVTPGGPTVSPAG